MKDVVIVGALVNADWLPSGRLIAPFSRRAGERGIGKRWLSRQGSISQSVDEVISAKC
ncbi:hypothetical protein LNP17_25535 [Klebsiella variicola subsp. variicola]|nr:hypothetical protein [Klebsiella variicola subsp. variicola]